MPRRISRRSFLSGLVAAPALVGLYTWRVEPVWLEIVRRDLPVRNLPAALAGKTLAHLSDIHIGKQVDDEYLADVFRRVTALKPDIVVHTGDLITYGGPATFEQAKSLLKEFPRGQLGTVAILGNHDYGVAWSQPGVADHVSRLLADAGATVLRNQSTNVAGLTFVGLDDLWSGRLSVAGALANLTLGQPAIVLCHNPDACDLPGWEPHHGWILAGHTHGGQCKPPFLPAPLLPVKNRRYTAGGFSLSGGRSLYISRGVGHLLRVRFNVSPEATIFNLRSA